MKVPISIFLPHEVTIKTLVQFVKDLVWKLKTTLEEHSQTINTNSGFGAMETKELTIALGVVDVGTAKIPFRRYTIDTQDDDATDDLDTISGGHEGEILLIQAENSARTVVVQDAAGMVLAGNCTLDNTEDVLLLMCTATDAWVEVSRSNNGA